MIFIRRDENHTAAERDATHASGYWVLPLVLPCPQNANLLRLVVFGGLWCRFGFGQIRDERRRRQYENHTPQYENHTPQYETSHAAL